MMSNFYRIGLALTVVCAFGVLPAQATPINAVFDTGTPLQVSGPGGTADGEIFHSKFAQIVKDYTLVDDIITAFKVVAGSEGDTVSLSETIMNDTGVDWTGFVFNVIADPEGDDTFEAVAGLEIVVTYEGYGRFSQTDYSPDRSAAFYYNGLLADGEIGDFALEIVIPESIALASPNNEVWIVQTPIAEMGPLVPEPSSLALLCVGMVGLLGFASRRR